MATTRALGTTASRGSLIRPLIVPVGTWARTPVAVARMNTAMSVANTKKLQSRRFAIRISVFIAVILPIPIKRSERERAALATTVKPHGSLMTLRGRVRESADCRDFSASEVEGQY